jgi:serine/threonine protein kinase
VIPGYEILREIGRGGMARVYAARDLTLGWEVAIKIPRWRVMKQRADGRRFLREAQITASLSHPGIPPLHMFGALPDGRPFIVMKLIRGRTLADVLSEGADPAETLPRVLRVFEQVCQAVAFAHSRGVIHRSLKPQDVMIGAFGEVQVIDWGLAKIVTPRPGNADTEESGVILGTPAYVAPEQARGEAVDYRADVFGLGAILCEILTGQPPYGDQPIPRLVAMAAAGELSGAFARLDQCEADPELVALCQQCLAPNPADRYPDASAVARAVATYQSGSAYRWRDRP